MLNIKGGRSLSIKNVEIMLPGFKHGLVMALCNTVSFPNTTFHLTNVPLIDDTYILKEILVYLGADCHLRGRYLTVCTKNLINKPIPENLSRKIHGALYLFPVLLARFGNARIGTTGGCRIGGNLQAGARPVEHMVRVMEEFGFEVYAEGDRLYGKRLQPCKENVVIDLQEYSTLTTEITGPYISGATKTALLLAGSMQDQQSLTIKDAYSKPDVTELLVLFEHLGYQVVQQMNVLYIQPRQIKVENVFFELLGDLSVFMTYITIAVLYQHDLMISVERIDELYHCLTAEFNLLKEMGVTVRLVDKTLIISPPERLNPLKINVYSTSLYSDHQPFFALMLTQANGVSSIHEFVWVNRFTYARELQKLGYQLEVCDNTLFIQPSTAKNTNIHLQADDLRAAAVLVLAACYSKGNFTLQGDHHLKRGYEDLIPILTKMGADIQYI